MRTYAALIFSLILHLLIYGGLNYWEKMASLLPLSQKLLSLEEEAKKKRDQVLDVVLLEKSPNAVEKTDSQAAFLAAQNQRVKEQTRARFQGVTANRQFPNRMPQKPRAQESRKEVVADNQNGTVTVSANERLQKALANGISTLSESVPDHIKYGDFTSLNTDQYLYYSFFSRIAPRLRFHWENGVENVIESLSLQNFSLREEKTFVTEVEVRLDSAGNYRGTSVYRSSGIPSLDQAVVHAFEVSTPFVNPPREMVQDDGLIRLYYGFRVFFSPQYFAKPEPRR